MGKYKITFTPREPWFFGNEKGFVFPGQTVGNAYRNSYFIKSEPMPSQSTVLGALRYLLIPNKQSIQKYTDNDIRTNAKYIGPASFNPDKKEQTFGKIEKISPVFIIIGNDKTLIPCPYDHRISPENKKDKFLYYTPFKTYSEITSAEGIKLYTKDFDAKSGVFHGFVSLNKDEKGYRVYASHEIIAAETRVGNSTKAANEGFFKKEYCRFALAECCFAVYAELNLTDNDFDKSLTDSAHIVALGQGKSMFTVEIKSADEETDMAKRVEDFLKESHKTVEIKSADDEKDKESHKDAEGVQGSFCYCFGDTFVSNNTYDGTLFAVTDIKDYRYFSRGAYGKVTKGENLKRVLKAGSVVIAKSWSQKNDNAEQIGYNNIINTEIGGKKDE